MSFDRAWVLFIAWIPLAWMALEWRRTARHSALMLKAFSLFAILLALAEPRLATHETKVALAVLVDTSASVSASDLERASGLAGQMSSQRGRNWMEVIPFARSARALKSSEDQGGWKLEPTSGDSGRATDIETAVGAASASLPSGLVPRIALISDGLENKGSLARAAWQAQQLGIPIDTFALSGRPQPALRLESVSVPSVAFTGEQFPIDVVVSAPSAVPAEIELTADGKASGQDRRCSSPRAVPIQSLPHREPGTPPERWTSPSPFAPETWARFISTRLFACGVQGFFTSARIPPSRTHTCLPPSRLRSSTSPARPISTTRNSPARNCWC